MAGEVAQVLERVALPAEMAARMACQYRQALDTPNHPTCCMGCLRRRQKIIARSLRRCALG